MTTTPFAEDHFAIKSEETGFEYAIAVEVPSRYEIKPDAEFPVVVCLDGMWTYGPVRDAFRILPMGRELPEAVVVGVGYAEPDLREIIQRRAVDLTPTQFDAPPETGVRIPAAEVGRAAPFRRFLIDTLMPMVAERYRTGGDRTLVGHSFSGLFGVDTLLTEPAAFDRWVLASPSVWWHGGIMFEREAEHAARTDSLKAIAFLSVGGDELEAGFGGHQDFYEQLAARRYRGLDLSWAVFPNESHQSVVSSAVVRGLRVVNRDRTGGQVT